MVDQFCARTRLSKSEGRWTTMQPPDPDWCCYRPARFVKPGDWGIHGKIWLCAECWDEWMGGECFS